MIRKIVIVGPESTGKSTLCEQLAEHYKTIWVKEYAREYLLKHGTDYTFDNLLDIAKGQVKLEEDAVSTISNKPLFIDTDMYVMKVWYEYVFGRCEYFVLDEIAARNYDLYLLCNIDLPWIEEPMREYPDEKPRKELYNIYKDLLINQTTPWVEISGNYEERLQKAIAAVNQVLKA